MKRPNIKRMQKYAAKSVSVEQFRTFDRDELAMNMTPLDNWIEWYTKKMSLRFGGNGAIQIETVLDLDYNRISYRLSLRSVDYSLDKRWYK